MKDFQDKIVNVKYYNKHFFKSEKPNIIYLIAIIDYLQLYDMKKYLETVFKSIFVAPTNPDEISSVSPDKYKQRFINYFASITNLRSKTMEKTDEDELIIST